MAGDTPSPVFEDIFSKCLLCGACVKACPRGVDITGEVRRARAGFSTFYGEHGYQKFLAKKVLENPELLSVARRFGRTFRSLLHNRLPHDSGLRLQLAVFDHNEDVVCSDKIVAAKSEPDAGREPLVYFPGCSATHLYPEVSRSCKELFSALGYSVQIPEGLACCGLALDAAGNRERSRELAKKNVLALERHDGRILVSCGSCYAHLRRYQEVLEDDPAWGDRVADVVSRLVEVSQLLTESREQLRRPGGGQEVKTVRVFYHDPCHLRNELNITLEPRSLLQGFKGVELLELEDGPQCCGQGGLFHLGAPELAAVLRDDLAAKVLSMKPDIITSTCSGCLMQWRTALTAAGTDLPVLHLAELITRLRSGNI